jgi:hypothetical protein
MAGLLEHRMPSCSIAGSLTWLAAVPAQGRWARHEEELEKAASSAQVLSMEQGKASKRQIFSRWGGQTALAMSATDDSGACSHSTGVGWLDLLVCLECSCCCTGQARVSISCVGCAWLQGGGQHAGQQAVAVFDE